MIMKLAHLNFLGYYLSFDLRPQLDGDSRRKRMKFQSLVACSRTVLLLMTQFSRSSQFDGVNDHTEDVRLATQRVV